MRLTPLISTAFSCFWFQDHCSPRTLNLPAGKIASHAFSRRSRRLPRPPTCPNTKPCCPRASIPRRKARAAFKVTVVDYNQARRILTEKAKSCPAGAEPCLGGPGDEGHWKADIRGAIDWATWQLMKRDAKVTLFVWAAMDQVEGRTMQLTNNADKSRTFMRESSCTKTSSTSSKERCRRATRSRACFSNRWDGWTRMGSGFAIQPLTTTTTRSRRA